MKTFRTSLLSTLTAACFLVMFSVQTVHSITSEISPSRIAVDSLYHGSSVVVSGETDAEDEIIIKFSSPKKEILLRKKGKRSGLLWMNVGELELNPVPDVYLVYATGDINSMLNEDQQDRFMLGYDTFRRVVEVTPVSGETEKEKWIREFLHFKEKNKVYGIVSGQIETQTEGSRKTFNLSINWPYQAPPQDYTVGTYAVRDGIVLDYKETTLSVEKVGALKYISDKAYNSSAAYGIISILIAIASGFIVSIIFKGGGGGH